MFKDFTPALFKKNKGFTLIELIVVSGIIIFMTAFVLINYRPGGQQLALNRSAHKLAQDIRRAQEMTMSSRKEGGCGVDFQGGYGIRVHKGLHPEFYLLFADCNNDKALNPGPGGDQIVDTIYLEKGVEVGGLPANLRIIFSPPDPTITLLPGTGESLEIVLCINGQEKSIHINNAGLIYVE